MSVVQYTGATPLAYDTKLGRSWSVGESATVDAATAAALVGTGSFVDVTAANSSSGLVMVGASRTLNATDNGQVLECTASGLTLTYPVGLPAGFACAVIRNGTTTIASDGTALLNGATTSIAATSSLMITIQAKGSASDSAVVVGS